MLILAYQKAGTLRPDHSALGNAPPMALDSRATEGVKHAHSG